ncbi:MAG: SRPBCC domain-containing protein [Myxococcales bacterium]|nr:SRPBCC domain-containing protein [Myxococcales bacterium]
MAEKRELSVTTTIKATPSAVWVVLTDTPCYPDWDPQCDAVEGDVALGHKIRTYSTLDSGRGFRVTELVPGQRMTWESAVPLGLLRDVRTFTLRRVGEGATELTVRHVRSGPLLRLKSNALPASSEALERFAEALKARSEGSALAAAAV